MVETEQKQEEKTKKSESTEKNAERQERERQVALVKEAKDPNASAEQQQAEQQKREADTKNLPNSEIKKADNSIVRTGENGRVSEVVGPNGEVTKFGYDANGQLNSFSDKNGTWTTTDGVNWTNGKESKQLRADVYGDGNFAFSDGKQVTVRRTDGTTVEQELSTNKFSVRDSQGRLVETHVGDGPSTYYDHDALEKTADAIYSHTGGRFGTGEDEVNELLKDKTEAEKQILNEIYLRKYNKTLEQEFRDEMEGSELDKALGLLNKKDNDANDAARLHTNLIELSEWTGRSAFNIEKDVRQTLSTMNSKEIAELDAQYREKYNISLRDALMNDTNMTAQTKAAVDIYLKGSDQRTNEDNQKLFQNALQSQNVEMFNEAMAMASPESRAEFMAGGGKEKIQQAFFMDPTAMQHALDYAEGGKLSTAQKVRDNTSIGGDNEEAIEQALKEMTPEERKAYLEGKNPELREALEAAGDPWEVAKWEDQIAFPGGTLVTKLAAHRGSVYDSSTNEVLTDIENMSEEDWKRYKTDENYRKRLDTVISDYLDSDEYPRAKAILDEKMKAQTYEQAKTAGNRDIELKIADNTGTFNNDEAGIWDSIEKMTPAEQEKYRSDAEYRKRIDDLVANTLDAGAEQDAARAMLERVKNGQPPTADIVDKLNKHASDNDTDEAQVIRDLQEAFDKDPTLRQRLNNPQTEEDRKLAERFNIALHRALDDDEYETYAKPLMETGTLSADLQNELNEGYFDDDEQGYYKDMVSLASRKDEASQAERQRLLNDQAYQDQVFENLSAEERKIALNALKQGEMRPEDKLYSYMVGAGTSETEIKSVLKDLTAEQKEQVKREYARKYGTDLSSDLMEELGGQDSRDAKRMMLREATSDREDFNRVRDEVNESRDGLGREWVDGVWDGTGYMTDDAVLKYQSRLSDAHSRFQQLSPEEQKALRETVQQNIDAYVRSEGAAADMLVDAVIIAAGILGAKFTGGVSLSLLAYTTMGGALFKVLTKSAVMGSDYDWDSTQVVTDALTGGVDAATIFLGPAQLAQALKLGEKGAATATRKLLTEGSEQLIKSEMRDQLGKKMFETVATAISNGEQEVSDQTIKKLAKAFAVEGKEEVLEQQIKQSLREGMEEEARKNLQRLATEATLNSAAGAGGGGSSGFIRGVSEWDTSKSVSDNLKMVATQIGVGTLMGGGMGGAFTVAMKGPGQLLKVALRSTDGSDAMINAADNPHLTGIRRKNGEIVDLPPGSSVRLEDGDVPIARPGQLEPPLSLTGKTADIQTRSGVLRDTSVLLNGEPVSLTNGEVTVGRNLRKSDGSQFTSDPGVSRDHGKLRYDAESKEFKYTDTSSNGTYVRRAGTNPNDPNAWIHVQNGQEITIRPDDEIRLGTKDGPQLELLAPQPQSSKLNAADEVDLYINDTYVPIRDGETIRVGRDHKLGERGGFPTDPRVSANHGQLYWDEATKSFYFKDTSSNGTYIKREGSNTFEHFKGRAQKIGPNDEIRLASVDGPRLELYAHGRGTGNPRLEKQQAFLNGQPLPDGKVVVGAKHQPEAVGFRNGDRDVVDGLVSREHGTLEFDPETGDYHYTDHSMNGTYIKRAGSEVYEKIHNKSTKIGPHDEVRLGSEDGPQLTVTTSRGRKLDDGSVVYQKGNGQLIERPDGTTLYSDGLGINRLHNAKGQVESVWDATGGARRYGYDDATGELNSIAWSNGGTWTRNGDTWVLRNPDGSQSTWRGKISVESDGSVRYDNGVDPPGIRRLDDSVEVHHRSGRIEYTSANLDVERRRFAQLIENSFSNPEQRARMHNMAEAFESRLQSSPQEIALTYHHLNRLMHGGPESALSQAERLRLAEQTMFSAARPASIDQGRFNTCNVTTVEHRIFARHPSEAASLIADVATTGKYTAANGKVVDLRRAGLLLPDHQSKRTFGAPFGGRHNYSDIKLDGVRTWSSQLFETTAVNLHWQNRAKQYGYAVSDRDVVMYRQETPDPSRPNDSGERLYKYTTDSNGNLRREPVRQSDGTAVKSPNIWEHELTDIYNQIVPSKDASGNLISGNEQGFVITAKNRAKSQQTFKPGDAIEVGSVAEFDKALWDATQAGKLPLVLYVDVTKAPFTQVGDHGAHVINIHRVTWVNSGRKWRAKVEYTNQWGEAHNRLGENAVWADELFNAVQ
jgi:hypothetical protein